MLEPLSLPTSFSHMHQPSFYSGKTLGKAGAIWPAPVRATRGRGAAANPPCAAQGTACSLYFITYSCTVTYIISVIQPSPQKMCTMTSPQATPKPPRGECRRWNAECRIDGKRRWGRRQNEVHPPQCC